MHDIAHHKNIDKMHHPTSRVSPTTIPKKSPPTLKKKYPPTRKTSHPLHTRASCTLAAIKKTWWSHHHHPYTLHHTSRFGLHPATMQHLPSQWRHRAITGWGLWGDTRHCGVYWVMSSHIYTVLYTKSLEIPLTPGGGLRRGVLGAYCPKNCF